MCPYGLLPVRPQGPCPACLKASGAGVVEPYLVGLLVKLELLLLGRRNDIAMLQKKLHKLFGFEVFRNLGMSFACDHRQLTGPLEQLVTPDEFTAILFQWHHVILVAM